MKKKILFANGHLNVGGVENSLINVLKSIDYNSYEIDLLLFEELGDYVDQVPKEVNIIYFDITKAYGPIKHCIVNNVKIGNWFAINLRILFLIKKVLGDRTWILVKPLLKQQKNYDCAIAYRVGICTDIVGFAINSRMKITWWHHGGYDYTKDQTKRWIKVLKKFDRLIAVSDSTKEMLVQNINGVNNKILTIPNIINTEEIRNKANEITGYDINFSECITLLSIGRLSPEKGMVNCVHACKKLIDSGYPVKWYLIGEGTQRDEIERCIIELNLENNIFLLGAISNPYPYMKNVHIYVHPSLVESMSITVLEALALNTPVIVAKSMGPMEFIRHNENGLLVEPTPDGLYKGIVTLLRDENLYDQLKNDKSEVLNAYSPEVVMKKIYGLIEAG